MLSNEPMSHKEWGKTTAVNLKIRIFQYSQNHEGEKAGLKLNIQKTKLMASGPTISWQTDREKMETVQDFIFLGSKITADGD